MRLTKKMLASFFSIAILFSFVSITHAEVLEVLVDNGASSPVALSTKCSPVEDFSEELQTKIQNIKDTFLSLPNGAGLAATQVGYTDRFFVISQEAEGELIYEEKKLKRKPGQPLVFINPKIIETSGKQIGWESCFSLLGYIYKTERPLNITIEALDENGNKFTFKTTGFWAKCICHENDHLDGILCKAKALETREAPEDE